MKWQVTIHKPVNPLTFQVELSAQDMLLLERWLVAGQPNAVSYHGSPYVPEPDAPWPVGPTLADM